MNNPDLIGQAYKLKSAENFSAAQKLAESAPNAAANRAYYACYQSLVGEFESKSIKPELIDKLSKDATLDEEKKKWRHSVVVANGTLAGLGPRECAVIRMVYNLRVTADYQIANVQSSSLKPVLVQLRSILDGLGIRVQ